MFNSVLAIDKIGSYIKKSGNRFIIQNKDLKEEYSADKISQLLFLTSAAISSEAIRLAVEKNIDIVYLDWRGNPFARTYRPILGGTTLTRRKQLEAYFSPKGAYLVQKFVEGKTKSQDNYLKSLAKDHKENIQLQSLVKRKLNHLTKIDGKIDDIREKLLGIEGSMAAIYFKGLGLLTGFKQRNPEADDPFNVCLNYGYGMLYSEVERACVLAGLDPYLGFFHTDRYGKPSMVLDVVELFRVAVVDRAIVTLFNRGEMDKNDFDMRGDRTLAQGGRKKIVSAVLGRLNTQIEYRNKKLSLKDIVLAQTREIAGFLLEHQRDFKPFIYK